jgi:hypothetical protein
VTAGSSILGDEDRFVWPFTFAQEYLQRLRVHANIAESRVRDGVVGVGHSYPGRQERPAPVVLRKDKFTALRVLKLT